MPNKDGTGPRGEGPRTGRGLGRCKEEDMTQRPFNRRNRRTRLQDDS